MSPSASASPSPQSPPQIRRVGILFAGGPAPAANAVISTAASAFLRRDIEVFGILNGYAHLVEALNGAGQTARAAGVGVAYHNHDFDFAPFPDGSRPYDYLLAHLDPRLVQLELDLFWATKAGADPLDLFGRAPGRFPMVHVKDMDASGGMTDVGKGKIDWARIFAQHRRAGIRHYFVEHDEPADPWTTVTDSYEYLRQLSFAAAA